MKFEQNRKDDVLAYYKVHENVDRLDSSIHCIRGLEGCLSSYACQTRHQRRSHVTYAVLDEQTRQSVGHFDDPERIATASARQSFLSRLEATERGAHDKAEASSSSSSTPSSSSSSSSSDPAYGSRFANVARRLIGANNCTGSGALQACTSPCDSNKHNNNNKQFYSVQDGDKTLQSPKGTKNNTTLSVLTSVLNKLGSVMLLGPVTAQ